VGEVGGHITLANGKTQNKTKTMNRRPAYRTNRIQSPEGPQKAACASPEPKLRGFTKTIGGRVVDVSQALRPSPVGAPRRRQRFLVRRSKADSSLIHPSSPPQSAMGLQVSKEIRSKLEYSTLEELLADDKVISFELLENHG
jgi:hypothetical protein